MRPEANALDAKLLIIELVEFNLRGSLVPDNMASIMALELARN